LSEEKTKITHIHEGFDFLGFNVRKYKEKLLIKPAKRQVKDFLANIHSLIKRNKTVKTVNLIRQLNPKIRGWANYFRHVVAKETFGHVDHSIFKALWTWAKRRHPNKRLRWVRKKYFGTHRGNQWVFYSNYVEEGQTECLYIDRASQTTTKRHLKIK